MTRRPVGSIRWRKDGVARVELSAGRDPLTGKRNRMSVEVHGTPADAERALAKMLLDIGQLPSGRAMTVREYLDNLYKPSLDGRVRKETRIGYVEKLDNHVIPKLGEMMLAKLEPYVLDRWRDDLVGKMSGTAASNVYRTFSAALNKAVKWRLIDANPLKAVDPPRKKPREIDTLTADEVISYLKAFRGHAIEPVVIVALATGLRPCEVYALTWADIDLGEQTVVVHRGLHQRKSEVWFEPPKSDRSHRTVSLPAWSVEALRPLRGIGPLVSDSQGHMAPTAIARLYKRQVHAESLRYVPMRDLRHTHATLMLEAGVDVVVLSRRLGHSTVSITDQYYLRPKQSSDQAAADAFGKLLASSSGKASKASAGVKKMNVNK